MSNPQGDCISTEQEYGLRLQLLNEKTTQTLRNKFHQYFSSDPKTLFKELSAHKAILKGCLRRKILYREQYALLLPSNGLSDSKTFDISLLIFLLRELCALQEPITGWDADPSPTDQTESANLVRVRKGRNKIQHRPLQWDVTSFNSLWDEIGESLIGLGATKDELKELKECPIDPVKVQELKAALEKVSHLEDCLDGVSYEMFTPIPSFMGREEEIKQIHENLINMDDNKTALVLTGLGGVGKSELVRAYCLTYAETFYKNNIIWINGKNEASITSAFNNVAEIIKLDVKDDKGQFSDVKVVMSKVFRFFANRYVLFVFDNVDNEDAVKEFLNIQFQPGVQKPYVLITSQYTRWGQRFVRQELSCFTPETAEEFVSYNLKHNSSFNEVNNKKLCALFEYLPLALQQAVAYIHNTGIAVDAYLSEFQSHQNELLSEKNNNMLYSETVMTTWNMAMNKTKAMNNPLSIKLMNIFSYLDGKNIQKDIILEVCDHDVILLNRAISILKEYSLINVLFSNDGTKESIVVHSLVQVVVRINENVSNQEPRKDTLTFLHKLLDNKDNTKKRFLLEGLWIDHVSFMVKVHNTKDIMTLFVKELQTLYDAFHRKGKLNNLSEIIQTMQIFASQTNMSREQCVNLSTFQSMVLIDRGRYDAALQILYSIESKQSELYENDNPQLLATQSNIADCLSNKGRYDEALEILYSTESKQSELYENDNPQLLVTQTHIAYCLKNNGRYDESLEKLYSIESKQAKLYESDNQKLLATQSNITHCLMSKGRIDEALEILYRIESKQSEIYENDNPLLQATQTNIASCLMDKGRYDEALSKFYSIESKQSEFYENDNPQLLATQSNITNCLMDKGRYDEALNKLYSIESKESELYENDSPQLLITQSNIAYCLKKKGRYDEALNKFYIIESKQSELYVNDNPQLLATQTNIANCLMEKGRYDEALNKFYSIESKYSELYENDSPQLLTTQTNIADCLMNKGRYNEVLKILYSIESKESELYENDNPQVLVTQTNIAYCLMEKGLYDEALNKLYSTESKESELYGNDNPHSLVTQTNIAYCLMQKGRFDEALEILYSTERKQSELYGNYNPQLFVTQSNISHCLMEKGRFDEALELLYSIESKQSELYGNDNPQLLVTQTNIAYLLMNKGRYDEAINKF